MLMLILNNIYIAYFIVFFKCFDIPLNGATLFQAPGNLFFDAITDLHHDVNFYMLFLAVVILFWIINVFYGTELRYHYSTFFSKYVQGRAFLFSNSLFLEWFYTYLPLIILILIALPAAVLIESVGDVSSPELFIHVDGRQWYWSYRCLLEMNCIPNCNSGFDANLLLVSELATGTWSRFCTDNILVFPLEKINGSVLFLVTASDVIHSWSIPALGVKADAIPGLVHNSSVDVVRASLYSGSCSELCGLNHAFMPIMLSFYDGSANSDWSYLFSCGNERGEWIAAFIQQFDSWFGNGSWEKLPAAEKKRYIDWFLNWGQPLFFTFIVLLFPPAACWGKVMVAFMLAFGFLTLGGIWPFG